jgi:crotonobetainyl-CoA:carnitine CoA-transferase CaiB-like acyl-CoA transferase
MIPHRDPGRAGRDERLGGPLAGLRVLDITSVIMGPYATAQFGDMGADVIKVELPTRGHCPAARPLA